MALLEIDEVQATAILDMQLRRLAALERAEDHRRVRRSSSRGSPTTPTSWRTRRGSGTIVSDELAEIVDKYGDERRTEIVPFDGEMSIGGPDRRGGRRRHHHPRRLRQAHEDRSLSRAAPWRQGGLAAQLSPGRHRRALLRHHHPPLAAVLHQQGSGVPRQGIRASRGRRDARAASTSRTCSRSSRTSRSPRCSTLEGLRASRRTWCWRRAPEWSRRPASREYDSNRTGGVIAINLREGDEVIAAPPRAAPTTTCCWCRERSVACDSRPTTRPCARWAERPGVIGMRFKAGDESAGDDGRPAGRLRFHRHRWRLREAHARSTSIRCRPRRAGRADREAHR